MRRKAIRAHVNQRAERDDARDGNAVSHPPRPVAVSANQDGLVKEQSIMSQLLETEIVKTAAPFVGAAGGALVATIAIERFGMRREVATFGGAVLAIAAAQSQPGVIRSVLEGAAIAGFVSASSSWSVIYGRAGPSRRLHPSSSTARHRRRPMPSHAPTSMRL
jgi:hypothetical protein